jgi:regulator of replication initiation timing
MKAKNGRSNKMLSIAVEQLQKQVEQLIEENRLKEVRIQKLERDLTDLRCDFHKHDHDERYASKENN